jgi:hypothetical protein
MVSGRIQSPLPERASGFKNSEGLSPSGLKFPALPFSLYLPHHALVRVNLNHVAVF